MHLPVLSDLEKTRLRDKRCIVRKVQYGANCKIQGQKLCNMMTNDALIKLSLLTGCSCFYIECIYNCFVQFYEPKIRKIANIVNDNFFLGKQSIQYMSKTHKRIVTKTYKLDAFTAKIPVLCFCYN